MFTSPETKTDRCQIPDHFSPEDSPTWYKNLIQKYLVEWRGEDGDTDRIIKTFLHQNENNTDFLKWLLHFKKNYISNRVHTINLFREEFSYFTNKIKYVSYIPEFQKLSELLESEIDKREQHNSRLISFLSHANKFSKKHPYITALISLSAVLLVGTIAGLIIRVPKDRDPPTSEDSDESQAYDETVNSKLFAEETLSSLRKIPHSQYAETSSAIFTARQRRYINQIQSPILPIFNVSDLNGKNGFKVSNPGYLPAVNTAGDFNGDGADDVIFVGNYTVNIVFGNKSGEFEPVVNLKNLNGTNGIIIQGDQNNQFAQLISPLKNFNGDKFDDLLIGDSINNKAYIVFGSDNLPSPFNVTQLNGSNGFTLNGIYSSASVGDVNADGLDDAIFFTQTYSTFVLYGTRKPFNSTYTFMNVNGIDAFEIKPANTTSFTSMGAAGDLNGDGVGDLFLSQMFAGIFSDGEVHVVLGSKSGYSTPVYLANLNGTNGFKLVNKRQSVLGAVVNSAGDLNNDGYDDLVVVTGNIPSNNTNVNYVIKGRPLFNATLNVSQLSEDSGFSLEVTNVNKYVYATGVGDVNGDRVDDLLIAAGGLSQDNRAYIIYGNTKGFGKNFRVIDDLNETNGFTIPLNGRQLLPVNPAGDVNNDGIKDILFLDSVIFGKNTSEPDKPPPQLPNFLQACPIDQPLTTLTNDIPIPIGATIILSLDSFSVGCKNASTPNINTTTTISNLKNSRLEFFSNNSWASAVSFFGRDQKNGKIRFVHDNSLNAPEFDFNSTDGVTTVTGQANIRFSLSPNSIQVSSNDLVIKGGEIVLDSKSLQVNSTITRPQDLQMTLVESTLNGYFSTIDDPSTPINTFSYYQFEKGLIKFHPNGTKLPESFTFQFSDGSNSPTVVTLRVIFGVNDSDHTLNKIIIGSSIGVFVTSVMIGLVLCYQRLKYLEDQRVNTEFDDGEEPGKTVHDLPNTPLPSTYNQVLPNPLLTLQKGSSKTANWNTHDDTNIIIEPVQNLAKEPIPLVTDTDYTNENPYFKY